MTTTTIAHQYAPVLQRMIELLGSDSSLKFGDAFNQATAELGLTVPEDVELLLLRCALDIIGNGRIPGAPSA